jgi:hypothetical protein
MPITGAKTRRHKAVGGVNNDLHHHIRCTIHHRLPGRILPASHRRAARREVESLKISYDIANEIEMTHIALSSGRQLDGVSGG